MTSNRRNNSYYKQTIRKNSGSLARVLLEICRHPHYRGNDMLYRYPSTISIGKQIMLRLLSTAVLAAGFCGSALATPIINSTGLASPLTTVTFSELTFAQGTTITNQFAPFGVTTSGHHYNSQGAPVFPGITGDYIGVSTTVPFVLSFNQAVTEAAFGYAKNPTTVLVEALLLNSVVESFSQAVTFNNASTAFLGFTGITFDSIRVTADVGEGLVDNVQIGIANNVPEPATLGILSLGLLGLAAIRRRRK